MLIKYGDLDVTHRLLEYKVSVAFAKGYLIGNVPTMQLNLKFDNYDGILDDLDITKYWEVQEDAQEVNDREALCNRFDKKIHDLELTRMVSLQMAPQIRMVQSSDVEMSEKIQSTLVNTIPLWKSQMIIALGVEHSRAAAEAQRKVSDLTNDLLKKNAEKLKVATVETAKESERGIVDMETLVATNESLMSTIDEAMHIQQEGRQKRREAESKLMQLEDELKNKMLNPRG